MVLEKIENLDPSSINLDSVSVDPVSLPQVSFGIPDWVSWWGNAALFLGKVALIPIGLFALGYGSIRGFKYCVSRNYGFAQPPPGYGMVVYRSLSRRDFERPKRRYGRVVTETIIVDGKKTVAEVKETVQIVGGKLIGVIINLNDFVVYPGGDICPEDYYHDPVSGLDIPIGKKINPVYQDTNNGFYNGGGDKTLTSKPEDSIASGGKPPLFIDDGNKDRVDKLNADHTQAKEGGNAANRFFREKLGVTWIGQIPNILDVVPELDVIWEERKDIKKPATVRRERQNINRITQVDQAIDVIDPPAIERGGYPWEFQLLIYWRQANLRKSWVEIPDSADQASAKILDAFLSFVQGVFILSYEGGEEGADAKGVGPMTPEQLQKKHLDSMDNKMISEEFYKYLVFHGELHYIREVLGREIKEGGIVIQNKALAPPYDKLITEMRTAEIRLGVAKIDGKRDYELQHQRARGVGEIMDEYENHKVTGPILATTGALPIVEAPKEGGRPPQKGATETLVDLTSVNLANQMFGKKDGTGGSEEGNGGKSQNPERRQRWKRGVKKVEGGQNKGPQQNQ